MLRTLGNMLRAILCLGVTGLIGYYNFGVNGWIGVATNAAFFALGFLLVSIWRNPEKIKSEPTLEAQSVKEIHHHHEVEKVSETTTSQTESDTP